VQEKIHKQTQYNKPKQQKLPQIRHFLWHSVRKRGGLSQTEYEYSYHSNKNVKKTVNCNRTKVAKLRPICLPNCPTKTGAACPGRITGWRWLVLIRGDVVTLVEHKVCPGFCNGTDDDDTWIVGCEALTDGSWPDEDDELPWRAADPTPGACTATEIHVQQQLYYKTPRMLCNLWAQSKRQSGTV